MALKDDIVEYLRRSTAQKARDMAAALGANRHAINSVLYRDIGTLFTMDAEYRWTLVDGRSTANLAPECVHPAGGIQREPDIVRYRRNLARLKRGVPPFEDIEFLAIGMERLQQHLGRILSNQALPRWFAVTGEYGEGKSFFQAIACRRALDAGFAVATLDVNKDEGALHQPQRHLSVVLRSIQSPLDAFAGHEGLASMLRHWLAHTPLEQVRRVLSGLLEVVPDLAVGCDSARLHIMVDGLFSDGFGLDARDRHTNSTPDMLFDDGGYVYRQFGRQGIVYRRATDQSEWQFYGLEDQWARLVAKLQDRDPSSEQNKIALPDTVNNPGLAALLRFLTAEDLVARASQARFHAAYRMQVALEWLRLTGHQGLFLFVDELDNVVRQISERGHPACFRTLAWYCSNRVTPSLRVTFATTPEVMSLLDKGYRRRCAQVLQAQKTVLPEECQTYLRWSREADTLATQGWDKCVSLAYPERLELYRRIGVLHKLAWGASVIPPDSAVELLARSPTFNTTRRWVRACVQLLDLYQQGGDDTL